MTDDVKENVIEWINGDTEILCTFNQKKFINKVKKLAVKQPNIVTKFYENIDGSICCHLPLKALKLYLNQRTEGDNETSEEDECYEC